MGTHVHEVLLRVLYVLPASLGFILPPLLASQATPQRLITASLKLH